MLLYTSKSKIHGFGLFTTRLIEKDQVFTIVFNKVSNRGVFEEDYRENLYGRYINHSEVYNAITVLLKNGIGLKAITKINENEEITVNYKLLIQLFEGDESAISLIKFW